jgi:hypothetical protein
MNVPEIQTTFFSLKLVMIFTTDSVSSFTSIVRHVFRGEELCSRAKTDELNSALSCKFLQNLSLRKIISGKGRSWELKSTFLKLS